MSDARFLRSTRTRALTSRKTYCMPPIMDVFNSRARACAHVEARLSILRHLAQVQSCLSIFMHLLSCACDYNAEIPRQDMGRKEEKKQYVYIYTTYRKEEKESRQGKVEKSCASSINRES